MIDPYYEDDSVTIYCGDCLELASLWVSADVLVTDPPYGIGWTTHGVSRTSFKNRVAKDFNGQHRAIDSIANDDTTETRDAALALWGEDKPGLVFGALRLPPPPHTKHVAVYVKPLDAGSLTGIATLRRDVEAIYVLGRWERPVTDGPSRASLPQHQRPPSIWRSSVFRTTWRLAGTSAGLAATSGHPHAKPTDVLRDLIALAPGTVVDPFMGSGSTLVAAKELGRRAIGIELDERHCETAVRRLSQQVLFAGEGA